MKAKYCIVPDTAKFFEFLAGLSFSESDLLHTRLIRPQKIFVDVEQSEWVIEYKAAAPVEERLALAVADKLAAAFSLHKVELSCCNAEANVKAETEEIPLPPEPPEETEFVVTNCSGQPIPEEIPLPEEPPQNDLESYHYEENGSCGSEAGTVGFKGSRKSTPFAAQMATETAAKAKTAMALSGARISGANPVRLTI